MKGAPPSKRLGRPIKPPVAGERIQLGVQVSPKTKALLEAAAEENHRSMSREAELRLEASFEQDRFAAILRRIGDHIGMADFRISTPDGIVGVEVKSDRAGRTKGQILPGPARVTRRKMKMSK